MIMSKRLGVVLLALATVCALAACKESPPPPAPDLSGDWRQTSDNQWYHVAEITDDKIEIWWYLPSYDRLDLYWSGSFTPPADGTEPYEWISTNHYTEEQLDASYKLHRASREETKRFVYQDGKIIYNVTSGHLRLGFALERVEDTPWKK